MKRRFYNKQMNLRRYIQYEVQEKGAMIFIPTFSFVTIF